MKQELNEFFNTLDEKELDELTRDFKADSLDRETQKNLCRSAKSRAGTGDSLEKSFGRRISRRAVVALAACVAVLASLAVAGLAYAADVREYNNALMFFDENGLSAEGLTKGEVKDVYRRIRLEVSSGSATPDEVRDAAAYVLNVEGYGSDVIVLVLNETQYREGLDKSYARYLSTVRYEVDSNRASVEGDGAYTIRFDKSTVKKLEGNNLLWSITSDRLDAHNAFEVGGGVIVSGWLPYEFTHRYDEEFEDVYSAAVMKLSEDGSFLWLTPLELENGSVSSVVENEDGSYNVFAAVNDHTGMTGSKLVVCRLNAQGRLLEKTETPSDTHLWVCDVVPFEDGYIGINYVDDHTGTHEQHVVKIDSEGRLSEEFNYGEEGLTYSLFDIKVFDGRLYISATVSSDPYADYYGTDDWWKKDIPDDEFTEAVKKAYTAVLLVCDTVGGEPRTFYQVEGSCGYALSVTDEGRLEWEVHSVYQARFTPMLSSRTLDGKVKVFKYYFAEDSGLVETVDTGEVTMFWR